MEAYNSQTDSSNQIANMSKGSMRVTDAFSKALLEKEYQQTLWKAQGSFSHMLALMKATESQMKTGKVPSSKTVN